MTILVFGKTGQVATELQKFAGITAIGRETADLSAPDCIAGIIANSDAKAVINAAAYTAVDKAEDEEDLANIVNGAAPRKMAIACDKKGIPFVHISTDYVFDGAGERPWQPDDKTAPLGAYGRSKLIGEDAVRDIGGTFAILRTSWVFSAHGNNFVKTMLRLGRERDELSIVADQIGGPTSAGQIAKACIDIANALIRAPEKSGTYHFSGTPNVSWADFARTIFDQSRLSVMVKDIPATEFPVPAPRPKNSRLDCMLTERVFSIQQPDWRKDLTRVLFELREKNDKS